MSVPLHHVVDGPADAPPLVLAGSLGSTVEMWRPQVDALAGRFRVIRLDHRGHGGSPVPPGPYAMPDLAGDVLALLDALGLDRVAFCGLSLGGMVGMWVASNVPERIDRLVLCCTAARMLRPDDFAARARTVREHGMESIAYWIPADQPDTLIYVLAFPSREAATASWGAFRADPEWTAARTASEADGPIVQKVDSVFMRPTDYSAIK